MKRREFLSKSFVAGSACTLAGTTAIAGAASGPKIGKAAAKCKITVLKKEYYQEYYEKYKGVKGKPCELFEIGQEIIVSEWWDCPKGFCSWAWADMRPMLQRAFLSESGTMVSCCTDGFRPVIFKLERIEE